MSIKYVTAANVISPKKNWALITILEDEGPGEGVLAVGRWDNDLVLAMRWNGDNKGKPIGNPQSRGLPTWFIVPDNYVEAVLGTLSSDKLALARNFFPKPR